ncbi:MAG: uracil-DNA glycosylase [Fimbriimonadia bacterium]|jgi:uracil-DNA glycosylase family 4
MRDLVALERTIVACARCPRLVEHCRHVAAVKRAAYRDHVYWGRPVPNFGDPEARILLVGLAPGAHGGNRTGRIFTGDRSGDFLFQALFDAGFASQSASVSRDDGMRLWDVYITAVTHCAPPANKPTPEEVRNCKPFLTRTLSLLPRLCVIVALGRTAYEACVRELASPGERALPFSHGAEAVLSGKSLLASYHPSQQNTFTGKLTPQMLLAVLLRARELADATGSPQVGSVLSR